MGFIFGLLVIGIVFVVIAGMWKIFEKAGQPGWSIPSSLAGTTITAAGTFLSRWADQPYCPKPIERVKSYPY